MSGRRARISAFLALTCTAARPILKTPELIKAEIKHRLEPFRMGHSTLGFEWWEYSDCRMIRELRDLPALI